MIVLLVGHDLFHLEGDAGQRDEHPALLGNANTERRAILVGKKRRSLGQKGLVLVDGRHIDAAGGVTPSDILEDVLVENKVALENADNGLLGNIVVGRSQATGGDYQARPFQSQSDSLFHVLEGVPDRTHVLDVETKIEQTAGDEPGVTVGGVAGYNFVADGDYFCVHKYSF